MNCRCGVKWTIPVERLYTGVTGVSLWSGDPTTAQVKWQNGNTTTRIIGLPNPNLTDPNNKATAHIATSIAPDITHPLNHHLTLLPWVPSECRYEW